MCVLLTEKQSNMTLPGESLSVPVRQSDIGLRVSPRLCTGSNVSDTHTPPPSPPRRGLMEG